MTDSSTAINSLEIGERLKTARTALGLTQQALAEKIESSKTGIQANETGRSVPGGHVLLGFINLGISSDWLLAGKGEMFLDEGAIGLSSAELHLFCDALEVIEMYLAKHRRTLPPEKKRKAVEALYKFSAAAGRIDAGSTEIIMQLAA